MNLPLNAWLAFWRLKMRYHSYEVEGLEHLVGSPPALIVGYHGRPFAYDMCMLTVRLYDELGYLPHAIVHRAVHELGALKWFFDGLGFVTADDGTLTRVIARGEHLVVTPGGSREGGRSFRKRYTLEWGERTGYLQLALKHGLRIVPVAAAGADDAYIGFTDSEVLGQRIGLPKNWAWLPWIGVGPLGLYPFSPPFPVRMHQFIGPPIDLQIDATNQTDPAALRDAHQRVTTAMEGLLERARRMNIGWRPSQWIAARLGASAPARNGTRPGTRARRTGPRSAAHA